MAADNDLFRDSLLAVAAGLWPGATVVNKWGRNTDIDVAAAEDVWSGGGNWVAPTAARIHSLVSTSANDDIDAGTGARRVRVHYLPDWDTPEATEDVDLEGLTPVAMAAAAVIINRMEILPSVGGGINAGLITATAAVDATVTSRIEVGVGQTQQAIYGFPSTRTLYLIDVFASILRLTAGYYDAQLLLNPAPDVGTVYIEKGVVSGNSLAHVPYQAPPRYVGPGILKLRASVSANNSDIAGGFTALLVDNS